MRATKQLHPRILENTKNLENIPTYKLIERLGFVSFPMAGIPQFSPAGLNIMKNIEAIVRKNVSTHGFDEIYLPLIQNPEIYAKSGRSSAFDKEFFKTNRGLILSPTNEEKILKDAKEYIQRSNQLPLRVFQIAPKFRDCVSYKGVMRNKEFLMCDAYSIDSSDSIEESINKFENVMRCIGKELSIDIKIKENEDRTYVDYIVKSPDGDIIYDDASIGSSVGMYFIDKGEMTKTLAIPDAHMVSYGIGILRLMHAVIETHKLQDRIMLPKQIAPFKYSLIPIDTKDKELMNYCDDLYNDLTHQGILTLYDDRGKKGIRQKQREHLYYGITDSILVGKREMSNSQICLSTNGNASYINIGEISK